MRRAGWAVVFFHYRGAWGSPGDFSFGHVLEDVSATLDWTLDPVVRREYALDGTPRTLVGHSMGGFAALAAGAHHPGVDCIVSLAGANLGLWGGLEQYPQARADAAQRVDEWVSGPLAGTSGAALVDEAIVSADMFDTRMMSSHLATKTLLMVAGTEDTDTPLAEHHAPLFQLVSDAGGDVQERILPADHAFSDVRVTLAREVVAWMDQSCRG